MDLTVEEFIEGLFTEDAAAAVPHKSKEEVAAMDLPPWFDREKYDQGRRFFRDNCLSLALGMFYGMIALLAVPSALRVFISTQRSSTSFTSYQRYTATLFHLLAWFDSELKPGSLSWRSMLEVRSRHYRTNLSSKTRKSGIVSQRDLSLTATSMICFGVQKPGKLGTRALRPGDWDAYMHVWKTVGYMMGIEDRYNTCRQSEEETRQVMKIIIDCVFAPCLDNVPEYFEHMAEMFVDGQWANLPLTRPSSLYYCRYLTGVPGYVLTEDDRLDFCNQLRQQLKGNPYSDGVESTNLLAKPAAAAMGLPALPPQFHCLEDYATLSSAPAYSALGSYERFKLQALHTILFFGNAEPGRIMLNAAFRCAMFFSYYTPFIAWCRYGFRKAYVNMFKDGPMDRTQPKINAEIYAERERCRNKPWYRMLLW